MNTAIRLFVLIPSAIILTLIGILGLGFGGLTFGSIGLAVAIVGTPTALIAWTILDYRKRHPRLAKERANK
jgi:hypothetical protein